MSLYFKKRKRFLKSVLVGISLFLIGACLVTAASYVVRRYLRAEWAENPLVWVLWMTLVCVLAYKPLDLIFTQIFKNYFFKKKSYRHITLMNLAHELATVLDLQELANMVVNTFGEVLHLKTAAMIIPRDGKKDFEIASAYGWNVSNYRRVHVPQNSPLIRLIRESGPHVLVRDRALRLFSWQEANHLAHDFDSLRAGWAIPLYVKEELVGILGFSAFGPSRVFDETDFQFFREFSAEIARAVLNARKVSRMNKIIAELQDEQSQVIQGTKVAAMEKLATGLAHEIHNPLTIISGKAQVLLLQKDREALDPRVEDVLKTIVKQTKRAADITRKLLMFSQGSGAPKEWLQLEQVLEDTIALISYQTSLEGTEVEKCIHSSIPPVYANVHELREVFLNLILNAVQSTGGKGRVIVEMSFDTRDRIIEIQISDSGPGIDPDHLNRLFDPFFTTRHEGVGLGLFVTRQIIRRYGGSIRVESQPGEGTMFSIQLPCPDNSQEPVDQGAESSLMPEPDAEPQKSVTDS